MFRILGLFRESFYMRTRLVTSCDIQCLPGNSVVTTRHSLVLTACPESGLFVYPLRNFDKPTTKHDRSCNLGLSIGTYDGYHDWGRDLALATFWALVTDMVPRTFRDIVLAS